LGFTILASSRHDDLWHICAPRSCGNQTDWAATENCLHFTVRVRLSGIRENAVCYNSDSLYVGNCALVRKWWNWQTHHLSLGVARTPNEVASAASASAGRGGLPSALRLYVEGLAERSGLRVELDIDPNLQRPCLMPREDSVRHSLGVANQYPLPCESQDRSIARRDQDGLCTASRIERV